ncbi:hypothetical protein AB6735_18965, partial [Mucilaginibacter sp. RCC_168]|uniref:hypothetical protein n=1 Tax=Mucilaginibacter sp. RCC_168 TaxID=3239221 RepID=UPI003525D161
TYSFFINILLITPRIFILSYASALISDVQFRIFILKTDFSHSVPLFVCESEISNPNFEMNVNYRNQIQFNAVKE